MRELVFLATDTIGAFLFFAALTKVLDYTNSVAALSGHLGLRHTRIVLPIVLLIEFGFSVLLFTGFAPRLALVCAAATFAAFGVVVARWVTTNGESSCGCFGLGIPSQSSWIAVARNMTISAVAAVASAASHTGGPTNGLSAETSLRLVPLILLIPIVFTSVTALDTVRSTRRARETAWRPY